MRDNVLTVRRFSMSLSLVMFALMLFVSCCCAGNASTTASREIAANEGIVKDAGNDKYYIYQVLYSGRGFVRIPVPRMYKRLYESDNEKLYKEIVDGRRKFDVATVAIFVDKNKIVNNNDKRIDKIVFGVESTLYMSIMEKDKFKDYKERRKKNRDIVVNDINNKFKMHNDIKIDLKYIYESEKSIAYIMIDNRKEYPKNTFIRYYILCGSIVYSIIESKTLGNDSALGVFMAHGIDYIKYFEALN